MTALNLARLYRAHITPRDTQGVELTAFVKAASSHGAIVKIAGAIAALEFDSTAEEVAQRVYNCLSAAECLKEGLGTDRDLRLFETGWSRGKPLCYVEHPLFLVADPAPLIRKWTQIPQPLTDVAP